MVAAEQDERERESFTVQCDDGRLSVTLDKSILQVLTAVANAVLNKVSRNNQIFCWFH